MTTMPDDTFEPKSLLEILLKEIVAHPANRTVVSAPPKNCVEILMMTVDSLKINKCYQIYPTKKELVEQVNKYMSMIGTGDHKKVIVSITPEMPHDLQRVKRLAFNYGRLLEFAHKQRQNFNPHCDSSLALCWLSRYYYRIETHKAAY